MQSSIHQPLEWSWLWIVVGAALFALFAATALLMRARRTRQALPPAVPIATLEQLLPESRFVTVGETSLHYVQAGAGTDLVLLHGIGASVYIWRFVFPILQMRHRVTAFDFAGFGKSAKTTKEGFGLDAQAESIAAALTALGIEKAMLVGSSMGGAIALWMAKRWPERFTHVVGLGPATDSSRVPVFTKHFAFSAPLFRKTVSRRSIRTILNYVVTNRALITEDVVDRYIEPFLDRGESLRAFVAATSVLSDRRLPRRLAGLRSKCLVIWGENDYLVRRSSILKLRKVLPEATYVYHPTGGHHIMEDEPVWLARKLEVFASGGDLMADDESVSISPR